MYGIGHVLSKNVFHETPKSSMEHSFKAGYMIKLDKTFEFHETKFHRVVWASVCSASILVVRSAHVRFPVWHLLATDERMIEMSND